jgi:hypothetical protein
LLGFLSGKDGLEEMFGREFANRFNIHRTRKGFPVPGGIDTFARMAGNGIRVVDLVVSDEMGGSTSKRRDVWLIPLQDDH